MTDQINSRKTQPDWERIEADYRAGVLSVREIASSQGITHGAINKRARRDGWERDLSSRIKAKAEALVSRREVSSQVSKEKADTDRIVVEANAEVIANIRLTHRSDIGKARKLANELFDELAAQTTDKDLLEKLGDIMYAPDDKGVDKLNELYRKIISLPSRVDSAKKLAETLKNLIGLEREAYGIDSGSGNDDDPDKPRLVDPMETARRVAFILAKAVHKGETHEAG